MGILRTAAVLGTGYFLYKKFKTPSTVDSSLELDETSPLEAAPEDADDLSSSASTDELSGNLTPLTR
jgi:hypothetical protein